MTKYFLDEWMIDVDQSKGLRGIGNDRELILLDEDNDTVAYINVMENRNIRIDKVGWNCVYEFILNENTIFFTLRDEE